MNIRLAGVAFCLLALSAPARGQEAERRALVHVTQTGPQAEAIKKTLERIKLPPGFKIHLYSLVPGARQIAVGPRGKMISQFPAKYRGGIFFAQHGSWNRTVPIGARVGFASLKPDGTGGKAEVFAEGWLNDKGAYDGRPVDVAQLPDGSLLVSDDYAGALYRITYEE